MTAYCLLINQGNHAMQFTLPFSYEGIRGNTITNSEHYIVTSNISIEVINLHAHFNLGLACFSFKRIDLYFYF